MASKKTPGISGAAARRKKKRRPEDTRTASPLLDTATDLVHNLLCGTELRRLDRRAMRILEDNEIIRGFAEPHLPSAKRAPREDGAAARPDPSTEEMAAALRAYLRGRRPRRPRLPRAPLRQNLAALAKALHLSRADTTLLTFFLAFEQQPDLKALWESFNEGPPAERARLIAAATRTDAKQVRAAIAPGGRLIASGVILLDSPYRRGGLLVPLLCPAIHELLLTPGQDADTILERILTRSDRSTLTRDDYAPLLAELELLHDLLAGALRHRRPGVNVLLYGPTGTGKTELARLLAAELEVPLFVAGLEDDEGASPVPHERLASLLMGQRVLPGADALMLFDELEDLFDESALATIHGTRQQSRFSKQWFNTLLEKNRVPTIWISNSTDGIDEAFLRRFTYVMPLEMPSARQRARILRRHLGADAEAIAPAKIERLAATYELSPALMGAAVASARLLREGPPDPATLERFLAPSYRLLTGKAPRRRPDFDPSTYCLDALELEGDLDLDALIERLATRPLPASGLTLCLYGPPGTGKSELVRHLAHRMDRPLILRRASDLISPWVGMTEQKIAAAFREAERDGAVLLFDEVDSFLRDRRRATQSWQVTETNEFLQQLETFEGLVACTTNLWEDIDRAALRRFAIKIAFRWLSPARALRLFETIFAPFLSRALPGGLRGAARERVLRSLARLDALAPGDFAAVSRRMQILGTGPSAGPNIDALLAALAEEVRMKGEHGTRRVGFASA